jgi:DivIVA domain-containing protein
VTVLVLYGFLAAIAAVVLFALFVFVLPRGEQISVAVPDSVPWEPLPNGAVRPDDLAFLRLPVGLRGYRFAEVDVLLDRLADELRRRDAEIEWLRGGRVGPDPSLVPFDPARPSGSGRHSQSHDLEPGPVSEYAGGQLATAPPTPSAWAPPTDDE